jgi:subtilisin family serine protease
MSYRARVLIVLLLVSVGGGALYLLDGPAKRLTEPSSPAADEKGVAAHVASGARDERAPEPQPVSCAGHTLQVAVGDEEAAACFGETTTVQNGAVRRYEVAATDSSNRWLRIEALGTTVLSAAMGDGSTADFRCTEEHCKGIVIGRHDVEGARVISLSRAALPAVRSPASSAFVSGEIRTLPEDRLPGLACTDQGVTLVTSDGSATTFCPKGGAGFEIGADGHRRYRFTNLDGVSIVVGVDQQHRVLRVEYEGDSTLTCATGCGVRVSDADASGERTFTFAGTTLTETGLAQRNAVLNGTLIVPPL